MKLYGFTAVFLLAAGLGWSADEPSLADRAAALTSHKRERTESGSQVLTNEDLKKAKGNVIYISTPAPPPVAPATLAPDTPPMPVADGSDHGDSPLQRQLDELRGRALRLRSTLEDVERERLVAAEDRRPALEEKMSEALADLLKTHESIGALSERLKAGSEPAPTVTVTR